MSYNGGGDGVVWVLGGVAVLLIGGVYVLYKYGDKLKLSDIISNPMGTTPPPSSDTGSGTTTPYDVIPPSGSGLDKFGLKMLNPTVGKAWVSNWDNGKARTIQAKGIAAPWVTDPDDPDSTIVAQDYAAHKNELVIDGKGNMLLSGENCRNYHRGPWQNVEMTAWYKRIKAFSGSISVIFRMAARTEHQDQYKCPGSGRTMGAFEIKGNGVVQARKEIVHTTPDGYADNIVASIKSPIESGMKLILRNVGTNAILTQGYLSDTKANGGNWIKVVEKLDKGDWPYTSSAALSGYKGARDGTGTCKKLPTPTSLWMEPATSCYFRNDGNVTQVSMASIREIAPLSANAAYVRAYPVTEITRPLYSSRVTIS